jgi:hypothetical protein
MYSIIWFIRRFAISIRGIIILKNQAFFGKRGLFRANPPERSFPRGIMVSHEPHGSSGSRYRARTGSFAWDCSSPSPLLQSLGKNPALPVEILPNSLPYLLRYRRYPAGRHDPGGRLRAVVITIQPGGAVYSAWQWPEDRGKCPYCRKRAAKSPKSKRGICVRGELGDDIRKR